MFICVDLWLILFSGSLCTLWLIRIRGEGDQAALRGGTLPLEFIRFGGMDREHVHAVISAVNRKVLDVPMLEDVHGRAMKFRHQWRSFHYVERVRKSKLRIVIGAGQAEPFVGDLVQQRPFERETKNRLGRPFAAEQDAESFTIVVEAFDAPPTLSTGERVPPDVAPLMHTTLQFGRSATHRRRG